MVLLAEIAALSGLVCLLHAPLDFAFTAPESWPLLPFHRVLWVLAFLAGALITRRGSRRTLLWTATGLGILSVRVDHSSVDPNPSQWRRPMCLLMQRTVTSLSCLLLTLHLSLKVLMQHLVWI